MKFHLTESDRAILKNTINTVNNLVTPTQASKRPVVKSAFAYAELTEQDEQGLWSAKEVYFDENGESNELEDGRTWGGDNPSIIVNGTVSAGQVIRIEAYYLVDSNDDEQAVWIGSAIGGGGSEIFRFKATEDFTLTKGQSSESVILVNDQDESISSAVVYQNKYDEANFYVGEILYGISYSQGGYLLDPFLAGIGG